MALKYLDEMNFEGKVVLLRLDLNTPLSRTEPKTVTDDTNQPVILVGHGMGGDTAVEVANELNQIEYGFRKVDLMVTLDSIGMNNDIIPQNVTSNLNIISDGDWLFNDGPNIARKTDRTEVINELRSEPHNELDDHPDIQFQVFEKINTVLGEAVAGRNIERNRIKQLFREQGIQGVHR